jgi:hypothetical protein
MNTQRTLKSIPLLLLAGLGVSGCAPSLDSSTNGSSTPTAPSSSAQVSSPSSPLTIEQFSPSAGALSSFPTLVQVSFSETVDTTSARNVSNWSYSCSTGENYVPNTIALNGSVATLTLPTIPSPTNGESCSLSASTSILDLSGNPLSGTLFASWTYTTGVISPNPSATPSPVYFPTGSLDTPMENDRVYGNVLLHAYASEAGTETSAVKEVSFWIDGAFVGSATSSPYTYVWNSNNVQNGAHTLTINVTDNSGNTTTSADSHAITVANMQYSTTGGEGGTGGGAYSDTAYYQYNLSKLTLWTDGVYVTQIQPTWELGFGSSYGSYQGGTHGSTNESSGGYEMASYTLDCTSYGAQYRAVGIFGYAGQYTDQLGLLCQAQSGGQVAKTWAYGGYGNYSYSSFSLQCPAGTYVVSINGHSGTLVDQLSLGCE